MGIWGAPSAEAFLSNLRIMPKEPAGKLEKSEAPRMQTKFGPSPGKKTNRLSFDELNEDCFKVAVQIGCYLGCGAYQAAAVKVDGQSELVLVNIKSMMKRFDLPEDVILSNLSNLGKIVRLVQEKRLLQAPIEDPSCPSKEDVGVSLLPIHNQFSSLIPLERIAMMANEQGRCFRISKRCYHLARSIDVYPGGFIAFDTGRFLGRGASARVKCSKTVQGIDVARRTETFNLGNLKYQSAVLKLIKILDEFRGKPGILDTLAMGMYENKKGRCKFVSFHPLYNQDLNHFWENKPSEKNRLKMAHQLLQGLDVIAEKGVHRDIACRNILLRTKGRFEAVISDFDFFRYHDEEEDGVWYTSTGLDYGTKREVWNLGNVLYYVVQTDFKLLPWDEKTITRSSSEMKRGNSSKNKEKINQENLNKSMAACHFSPELESLLRGMLAIDPEVRWTAKQSLEYFEKHLLPKDE